MSLLSKLCNIHHLLKLIEEETSIPKDVVLLIGGYSVEFKPGTTCFSYKNEIYISGENEFEALGGCRLPNPASFLIFDLCLWKDWYNGSKYEHVLFQVGYLYWYRHITRKDPNHTKWVVGADLEMILKERMSLEVRNLFFSHRLNLPGQA